MNLNDRLRRASALAILMLAGLAMGWLIKANRHEQHQIDRLVGELHKVSNDNDALRAQIRGLGVEPATPTFVLPDVPTTTTAGTTTTTTTFPVTTEGPRGPSEAARTTTTSKAAPGPSTTQPVAPGTTAGTTTTTTTPPATVPTTTTTRCQVNVVGVCIGRG